MLMRSILGNIEFIRRAKIVHGEKYSYFSLNYVNGRTCVAITCPEHGIYMQKPYDHLNGCGCKKCAGLSRKTNNEFISESKKIFGDCFTYNDVDYVSNHQKVIIGCKTHGDFFVTPNNHLSKKQGCPVCKESKGEHKIRTILNRMNIEYVREKTFDNCVRCRRKLPFDFYLPKQNLVIEYDGKQHFEPVDAFGGVVGYNETIKNDRFKNKFLFENNIVMLRISYDEYDNIETILKKYLHNGSN